MASLSAGVRLARAVAAVTLVCALVAAPAQLLRRAPLAFAMAGFFAIPLVIAALALACRWARAALRGRPLPPPPIRIGRSEMLDGESGELWGRAGARAEVP